MSEKKPYYRKRKGSVKTKPSEVEVNATSLDATSSTTPASDRVVAAQQKPKKKRYNRKPKSRLATEAEAWAVTQQSIADTMIIDYTADNTIDWKDAVRSTAAERGDHGMDSTGPRPWMDQMGFPKMPEGFGPAPSTAEDAKSKNSMNANTKRDKLRYNSYSDNDTEEDNKRYTSKSDHMLKEHKLVSAIALGIVFLGMMCVLSVWYMLTHN